MYSVNKATILGNLTRDPELRSTPNGQSVANFGVATNRKYKNTSTGEVVEDTQFHDVVAWGKLAEVIHQIFKKGNKIYLEGRLQTRQWEAPDGSKRYRTEIIMDNFVALTPRAEGYSPDAPDQPPTPAIQQEKIQPSESTTNSVQPNASSSAKPANTTSQDEEFNLDDIPF